MCKTKIVAQLVQKGLRNRVWEKGLQKFQRNRVWETSSEKDVLGNKVYEDHTINTKQGPETCSKNSVWEAGSGKLGLCKCVLEIGCVKNDITKGPK